jgi:hypothetical protein
MALVFISYASEDDRRLGDTESRGWVTVFDEALKLELDGNLKLWRDKRDLGLPGAIGENLSAEIRNADYLLPILSSYYGLKQYTVYELAQFFKNLGAKQLEPTDYIIPVMPRPIPDEQMLPYLSGLRWIAFFEKDADDKVVPYFDGFGRDISPKYFSAIREVASLIGKRMKAAQPQRPARATVYLGHPSFDQIDNHWSVSSELAAQNCKVVPVATWPVGEAAARSHLQNALMESQFSVHLLGANAGKEPRSGLGGLSILELDMAGERQKQDKNFRRLIWVPSGLVPKDADQQKLIQSLDNGSRLTDRDELVRGGIESFKEIIGDELLHAAAVPRPQTQ